MTAINKTAKLEERFSKKICQCCVFVFKCIKHCNILREKIHITIDKKTDCSKYFHDGYVQDHSLCPTFASRAHFSVCFLPNFKLNLRALSNILGQHMFFSISFIFTQSFLLA